MNRKIVVVSALIICLVFSACSGQYDSEDDFKVYIRAGGFRKGADIIEYTGNKSKVRIPSVIKGQPVIGIESKAFMNKGLQSVIIPDTVDFIGYQAFEGNQLTSIAIPGKVTVIEHRAFTGNQLTSVDIPEGVTTIGRYAFAGNQLTSVTIPDSVTSIGEYAFAINQLTGVIIPNNVISIGEYAFVTNQLTSITIPDNITIGKHAFAGSKFDSITIGTNVKPAVSRWDDKMFDDDFFYYFYLKRMMGTGTYIRANGGWAFEPADSFVAGTAEIDNDFIEDMLRQYEAMRYIHPVVEYYKIKDVRASSQASGDAWNWNYPVNNLIDMTWNPWAEGERGNGIGESFTFDLSERETIAGFALKNGHGNLNYFSHNNRVKSFKIYIDNDYVETINVNDSISFEQYAMQEPVEGETIRFEIGDVYPGTRSYDNTCIAEIAILRRTVSDSEFYENILFWLVGRGDGTQKSWNMQYENNIREIVSISDADSLLLWNYLPFDSLVGKYQPFRESKIALLENPSSLNLTDNLPRIDGATAMYPLYSSFVRAVYPEIDTIESIVQCNTTSEAYRRLIDGETDVIFCYEPSQSDRNAIAEKGKRFNLTPIAKDAFVFIVNEKNVLNTITHGQIRDIYSGRTTNWRDISGVDEPVIAYQRRENSGSQTVFQSIMRGDRLARPILDGEFIPMGMVGMISKVTSDFYNYNSAIGYTFLFYLTQMAGDAGIKVLAVDGVAPTRQNIQNNTYPFVQTVYAITTGNESENTKKFIEWILSEQGQELVAKTGYTPN